MPRSVGWIERREIHRNKRHYGYQTIAAGYHEATTDVVREMLGRVPVSFQAFAAANADVWKRSS